MGMSTRIMIFITFFKITKDDPAAPKLVHELKNEILYISQLSRGYSQQSHVGRVRQVVEKPSIYIYVQQNFLYGVSLEG